jgi:uncharacterized membrane protein
LSTKLAWLLLVLLLATCIVLAITLSIPQIPEGHDFTHPNYETMQRAPDGMERNGPVLWLGLSFAVLQFCIFACLMELSLNKQGRLSTFKKPLLVGLLLNVGIFSLMMFAYRIYARDGSGPLIGSFPWPTALMLYGLWPMQIIFVIIYVWYFDRGIFTAQDLEKFQQIVKARRQSMEENN